MWAALAAADDPVDEVMHAPLVNRVAAMAGTQTTISVLHALALLEPCAVGKARHELLANVHRPEQWFHA